MKQNIILKLTLASVFWSSITLSDDFGNNLFNRAKDSAKSVLVGIQMCRKKIKDSVRNRLNEFFADEEKDEAHEPAQIIEIRKMIEKLEHERLHPTCPSILHALRWNKFDDFYKLLKNQNTDVNIMHDERSLLHFVWYRHDEDYGLDMLRAILARPDLKIDQKGNGIGDHGNTVLGIAVGLTIWLKTFPYIKDHTEQKEIDRCIASIELLLKKGANPELMSEETKREFFKYCKTDNFQDIVVKIKELKQ